MGTLEKVFDGNKNSAVVVIPGFFSATNKNNTQQKWKDALLKANCKETIYVFLWDSGNLLNIINKLFIQGRFLPPLGRGVFPIIALPILISFAEEFKKACKNAKYSSQLFANQVLTLKQKYEKLSVYSYSLGTRVYYYSQKYLPENIFEHSILLAGASEVSWPGWSDVGKRAKKSFNCYTKTDMVLNILYKFPFLGGGQKPIGVNPLKVKSFINKNFSGKILGHLFYLQNSNLWYKPI